MNLATCEDFMKKDGPLLLRIFISHCILHLFLKSGNPRDPTESATEKRSYYLILKRIWSELSVIGFFRF